MFTETNAPLWAIFALLFGWTLYNWHSKRVAEKVKQDIQNNLILGAAALIGVGIFYHIKQISDNLKSANHTAHPIFIHGPTKKHIETDDESGSESETDDDYESEPETDDYYSETESEPEEPDVKLKSKTRSNQPVAQGTEAIKQNENNI
jgi:hypothetical protein